MRIEEKLQSAQILEYAISCNDYSQYLKRELVTARYTDQTIAYIINDLITNYTTDGFTQTGVSGDLVLGSISFNRLSVADCLEKLAKATSYVWYVDYTKDLHFFPKNTETGSNLTDSTGNYIYDSLTITEDMTQIKNAVIVQGGEQVAAPAITLIGLAPCVPLPRPDRSPYPTAWGATSASSKELSRRAGSGLTGRWPMRRAFRASG